MTPVIWEGPAKEPNAVVVYDANQDALVHVTQGWCDDAQKREMLRGRLNRAIHRVTGLNVVGHANKIEAAIKALEALTEEN